MQYKWVVLFTTLVGMRLVDPSDFLLCRVPLNAAILENPNFAG
jgi:hypothetical protein